MGSGKGKNRRLRGRGDVREVVHSFDVLPDAHGVSTKAFRDEAPPQPAGAEIGALNPNNVFMAEAKASGKKGPQYFREDYNYFQDVAEGLGVPIPQEDPYYHFGYNVKVAQNMLANALANGHRCFTVYGPPGTGKNTFVKQAFAALTRVPVFEMDVSSSDELEAAIGYDGVDVVEGDDGSVASRTVEKRGKLTRVAAKGGIIVLNEITELPRGQLTAIHNMIGSGIGDSERFIVIKSPNSKDKEMMIPVHPDTVFFFTYNPERSDRRPHQALLSRSVNFQLDHGSEEEEAGILARRVNAVLANNEEFQTLREKQGKPAEVNEEEVRKTVGFMRELRESYHDDRLEHEPDMRTSVMFEACRQLEAARERKAGIVFALNQLDFMFNQTEEPAARQRELQKYAASYFEEVEDIGSIEGGIGFTDN